MGRLLDLPTPVDPLESKRTTAYGLYPNLPWPEPTCSAAASSASPSCSAAASIAVLVAGEFRDFLPPFKPQHKHWSHLSAESVWRKLYDAVIAVNGPADLFVHSWEGELARKLVTRSSVCASVCEVYGREYVERVLSRYAGFRVIRGFLRFNNTKETPHIVDFFYKRYAALQLLEAHERRRNQPYRALILTRPDVVVLSKEILVPSDLTPSTIYLHNSDHHHDSTDSDNTADPMVDHGICGQMPNDWFAYGDRRAMGQYLSAFVELPSLHRIMRETKGSCDWWRCHNYRYNFTFLNNAEAYLGFHLRQNKLRCRELQDATPPVKMLLPPTRRRDWGDWRDLGPGNTAHRKGSGS